MTEEIKGAPEATDQAEPDKGLIQALPGAVIRATVEGKLLVLACVDADSRLPWIDAAGQLEWFADRELSDVEVLYPGAPVHAHPAVDGQRAFTLAVEGLPSVEVGTITATDAADARRNLATLLRAVADEFDGEQTGGLPPAEETGGILGFPTLP
jgi:hypothetical protein